MAAILPKRRWDNRLVLGPAKAEGRSVKARRIHDQSDDDDDQIQKEVKRSSSTTASSPDNQGIWAGMDVEDDKEGEVSDDMFRQRALFYRQAYRMTPDHFWRLRNMLSPYMKAETKQGQAFRLSATLRHFAGGDSESDHSIGDPEALENYVWEVVDAIHNCEELEIAFPSNHQIQQETAAYFEFLKSDIGIGSCVGSIGSMLVWIENFADDGNENDAEYFSESKKKYGLHLQGVCDHNGRFLDISLRPGSISDTVAFEDSDLSSKVTTENFLVEGLAFFGGESYTGSPTVVSPLPEGEGPDQLRDDFNFFQKQIGSLSDEAFTNLLQRWGILRRALTIPGGKTNGRGIERLVSALCKLHNFCLNDTEPMLASLTNDLVFGLSQGSLFVGDMKKCELLNCGNNNSEEDNLKGNVQHQAKQGTAKKIEDKLLEMVKERASSSPGNSSITSLFDVSSLL